MDSQDSPAAGPNTPTPRTASPTNSPATPIVELRPADFYFGICLGEGAYARVVHARLKRNQHEFAIKIMEKAHIKKENKVKYVLMEKNILSKLDHPLVIK